MEYGLIGEHLGHSYSKEIHGMIADYDYELKEIERADLDTFMKAKDFKAINVTIPYKQDVISYLDEIDEGAAAIGAVNTIVNKDGILRGYNTDFAGMSALASRLGIDLNGKKVLICGTGGTSKTAAALAASKGAAQVLRLSRSRKEGCITYEEARQLHTDADVIINTTPSGMFPDTDACPVDIDAFSGICGVIDVIYNPLRTNLVLDAQEKGIPAGGGLYMLAAQAVYACGHFLGKEMSREDTDRAFDAVAFRKKNIVLTGMPGCGKTTVGKIVSGKLKRKLVDTDRVITERIGMPIADYFEKYGEKAFRDIESEVIGAMSKESGLVIATGGGAVLRKENVRALKHNGTVVFIDRPLEKLTATKDRPLSSDREALKKRFDERYDIYRNSADCRVNGALPLMGVAKAVIKAAER